MYLSLDHCRLRRGMSLLELVAALVILALTLVPALRLMRDGLTWSRNNETQAVLATFCVSKMEEYINLSAATWAMTSASGSFTAEGYPLVKFQVTRSDSSGSGGIPGQLMAITVTAWDDTNNNGSINTGEASVVMATKLARMGLYESAAS
jgi:prepilin-type N-terminal cleavage/methylation domain-containing protein